MQQPNNQGTPAWARPQQQPPQPVPQQQYPQQQPLAQPYIAPAAPFAQQSAVAVPPQPQIEVAQQYPPQPPAEFDQYPDTVGGSLSPLVAGAQALSQMASNAQPLEIANHIRCPYCGFWGDIDLWWDHMEDGHKEFIWKATAPPVVETVETKDA